jgi:excisionase family DNA binding protein
MMTHSELLSNTQTIKPRLLNIKQAAQYLACSCWTLRQLEWSGSLPAVRNLGKRLLFDIRDLDHLVEQKKAEQ